MLLTRAPDPKPMIAPVSRSDRFQRRVSAAPRRSEAAASPPHRAAESTFMPFLRCRKTRVVREDCSRPQDQPSPRRGEGATLPRQQAKEETCSGSPAPSPSPLSPRAPRSLPSSLRPSTDSRPASATCRASRRRRRARSAPENFTGEKGKGGMATEGTGEGRRADLGQGWKISPSVVIKPGQTFTLADIAGPRRDPAHLDDADRHLALLDPAHVLGRRDRRPRSKSRSATSSPRAGAALRPDLLARRLRQPGQRLQLLLGDAVPQGRAHHDGEHRRRRR